MALTKIGTDGVKDDAVTSGKIPANAVGTSEIADNSILAAKINAGAVGTTQLNTEAVTTAKIADGNVTAAKLASGVQTTINNNADNRVITGSGTANTLNGEANLTFALSGNDPVLTVQGTSAGHAQLNLKTGGTTDHCSINFGDSGDGDIGEIRYTHSSDSMQFDTNNVERLRIDSSGNVGIGTTSPTYKNAVFGGSQKTLHISGTAAPQLRIQSSTSGQADLFLQAGNSGSDAIVGNAGSNGDLVFSTNNGSSQGTRLRILDDGGICFNSDTAAANALADYEEGTFTPTAFGWSTTGTNSYSTQSGKYVKIGRVVHAWFFVDWTNLQNAYGVLAIGGFPFTHNFDSTWYSATAVEVRYINYSGDTVFGEFGNGYGTSILLYAQNDNANHSYVGIDGAGNARGCITYMSTG